VVTLPCYSLEDAVSSVLNRRFGQVLNAAKLLRVRNWNTHYECNRTRGLKNTLWVPVPNRLDNDGYIELVDHPDGPAHFAAWIGILQVASRCKPRGTLLRDGRIPHTAASLARITRMSAEVFDGAIPRLVAIGWIEEIQQDGDNPQSSAEIPHKTATKARRLDVNRASDCGVNVTVGMEGTEGMQEWDAEGAFDEVWKAYPAKGRVKRPLSQQYFCDKIHTKEIAEQALAAIKGKWAASEKWAKGFVLSLPEWINQECWNEEPEAAGESSQSTPESTMDPETARRIREARGETVYRRWDPAKGYI
jgi:hypothetical protein